MNVLEIDLLTTKDKQVICAHDTDLGRLCGSEYEGTKVEDYNFIDLPLMKRSIQNDTLNVNYILRPDEEGKFLRLRDLIEAMPSTVYFSLEFKEEREEMVDLTMLLIKEFSLENRVFWGVSKNSMNDYIDEVYPSITRIYSQGEVQTMFIWYVLGCFFCCKLKADFLTMPIMTSEQQ